MVYDMNWIAVADRLPPNGETVLTYQDFQYTTAILMDGKWYLSCEGYAYEHEVYVPCGMGCCGDWKTEVVELDYLPDKWAELPEMVE
jgi:hypothetical protein